MFKYFLSILIFLTISCEQSTIPTIPTGPTPKEIRGIIKGQDGNPVNDVKVFLIYNLTDLNPLPKEASIKDTASVLNQNFPNPFEQSTNIVFELRTDAYTKLFITEFSSDDTVETLIDGNLAEGFYAVQWSRSVANALYDANLIVKISEDSVENYKISMLKNLQVTDSLVLTAASNIKTIGNEFAFKTNTTPLGRIISYTGVSPTVADFKLISTDLTFVIFKQGYKVLRETHLIHTDGLNQFEFKLDIDSPGNK